MIKTLIFTCLIAQAVYGATIEQGEAAVVKLNEIADKYRTLTESAFELDLDALEYQATGQLDVNRNILKYTQAELNATIAQIVDDAAGKDVTACLAANEPAMSELYAELEARIEPELQAVLDDFQAEAEKIRRAREAHIWSILSNERKMYSCKDQACIDLTVGILQGQVQFLAEALEAIRENIKQVVNVEGLYLQNSGDALGQELYENGSVIVRAIEKCVSEL